MPESFEQRITRLTAVLRRLRVGQMYWVERVAAALAAPSTAVLHSADIFDRTSVLDFGDVLKIHHAFSVEPFTKDKFEYALVQVLGWRGKKAALAAKGNRGHDMTVGDVRFSLKTQADKSIKRDEIWISKFMELGKGAWGATPGDLNSLRDAFLEHLNRYDRILTLRAISKTPNWHYELVEIPKDLMEQARDGELEMKLASKQHPKPGYCHVRDHAGQPLFHLYFDAGAERKLQVKALLKSACILHAEWSFTSQPA